MEATQRIHFIVALQEIPSLAAHLDGFAYDKVVLFISKQTAAKPFRSATDPLPMPASAFPNFTAEATALCVRTSYS